MVSAAVCVNHIEMKLMTIGRVKAIIFVSKSNAIKLKFVPF